MIVSRLRIFTNDAGLKTVSSAKKREYLPLKATESYLEIMKEVKL